MNNLWEKIRKIRKKIFKGKPKSEYTSLAPVDEIENGEEYLKALDWALKKNKLKNIALSGPWGSGKSSIIETYLKHRKSVKKRAIRISMASFVASKKNKQGEIELLSLNPEEIEIGILKQLFYKVNYKKIPQSRYRKLHKLSRKYIWFCLMMFSLVVIIVTFIFFRDIFNSLLAKIKSAGNELRLEPKVSITLFIIFVAFLEAIISNLYRSIFSKFKVNVVKLPTDTTLGRNLDTKDSIFNKNMDEIVYFFEETKYRFIFFEDLDRLNNPMIFVQLRELNTLLNNYNSIKKPIVFIYAIKDDIFLGTDRTKFFDFIIPVIPIINSTNSGEIFLEKIKKSKELGYSHELSRDFILDIAPFVEDMRILQNIYNEFVIYKKTICIEQDLSLIDEKMMALIIFKNLYPKDFADIQLEKGIIKKAFDNKTEFINQQRSSLHTEIQNNEDVIKNYKDESFKKIKELKLVMLSALASWDGILTSIIYDGNHYYTNDILKDSFLLSNLDNIKRCKINYIPWNETANKQKSISNLQEIVSPYLERIKILQELDETKLSNIRKKTEERKREVQIISEWTLKKILTQFGTGAVLSDNVRANALLVFLLRKGYIDETYANYINYFKGTSITKNDMNFVLSIKNEEPLPFNYKLSKIDMVVKRLQVHEFDQKSIYNFALLEFLLSNSLETQKKERFINQLSDETEKSWEFINEFINITKHREVFIQNLSISWPDMWDNISKNDMLSYERKILYLSLLICETDIQCLERLNSNQEGIKNFMVAYPDILQKLTSVDEDKIIQVIERLGIKFKDVLVEGLSEKVINYIFDQSCYEINKTMLERIVAYKDRSLLEQMKQQNYTTLLKLDYSPVMNYVHKNISEYTKNIVLSEKNTKESAQNVNILLEKNINNSDLCLKIISHEDFYVETLATCCTSVFNSYPDTVLNIWNKLLQENKVYLNWNNIVSYWSTFGFKEQLLQYIEKNIQKLPQINTSCVEKEFIQEFIESSVSENTFEILIDKLNIKKFSFDLPKTTEKKVAILIEKECISFNAATYITLKAVYPNLCSKLILCNQEDYIHLIDEIPIDKDQFELLLLHPKIKAETRQILVNSYGIKYMTETLSYKVINLDIEMTLQLFDKVWEYLDENGKRKLMLKELQLLDAGKFEACFKDLPTWYADFCDRSRMHNAKIENIPEHYKLAERLKAIAYITSFKHQSSPLMGTQESKEFLVCKIKAIRNDKQK